MKKSFRLCLPSFIALLLVGCKPDPYPDHPDYAIHKPPVKYEPSRKNLEKMIKQLQGSPYVWAEEGPDKFDCSGFTYYLYNSMGIEIPRVAREQAKIGKKVTLNQLQYGDLIFFATDRHHPHKITHVGVYLGDGWFTHASTLKKEVVYSNLYASPYYKKRLKMCRRYLPETSKPARVTLISQLFSPTEKTTQKKTLPERRTDRNEKKAILIKAPMRQLETKSGMGNFYVQVGSFIGKPDKTLLHLIKKHGLTYRLITFTKGERKIHKVLVGPYPTRAAARKQRDIVRERFQPDAFIAEIR